MSKGQEGSKVGDLQSKFDISQGNLLSLWFTLGKEYKANYIPVVCLQSVPLPLIPFCII